MKMRAHEMVLIFLMKAYRLWLSPMLPSFCRFMPTCSEYTHEAIHRHGARRGIFLGIQRLLKCHPFHKGGFDPIPPQA